MNKRLFASVASSCLCCYFTANAISMVYNFRIAQVTKPAFDKKSATHNTAMVLLFDQYREKYDAITKQQFFGPLCSYIHNTGAHYFRLDTALAHIKEKENHTTTFSGTETDDILATYGYNFPINQRNSITFSGLFGIPTHRLLRLQHVDFGYSQVGFGLQGDGICSLHHGGSILYGVRYLYFVPRSARDIDCHIYRFTIGNINDLLLAYDYPWQHHGIEVGYTAKFRYGCHCYPSFDDIMPKTNYLRSNFYLVYKYSFEHTNHQQKIFLYGSYGFDHQSKIFGNKNILTLWISWNIDF